MKKLLLFAMIFTLFFGCSKDKQPETLNNSIEVDNRLFLNKNNGNDNVLHHNIVAKIFSVMCQKQSVRNYFTDKINESKNKTYHAVSFLELLTTSRTTFFVSEFNDASRTLGIADFDFDYFINSYVTGHPNLSISIYTPEYIGDSDLEPIQENLSVFSEMLYDEDNQPQSYKIFKNGRLNETTTDSEGPIFKVLVLQEREGFTSLEENKINNENYFNKWSKVRYCDDLVEKIKNDLNFNVYINSTTISINEKNYKNPFFKRYYVTNRDITSTYNRICTNNDPPDNPSGGGGPVNQLYDCGGGEHAQRSTWNNKVLDERSYQIQLPHGNETLELHNDWCAWWDSNCQFQIDLFVSSSFNAEFYVPFEPGPYFEWYNEKLLKDKKFRVPADNSRLEFIPWQFENGKHGDEWKYLWTGKHRNSGDVINYSVGQQLGSSIGFADTTSGISISKSRSTNFAYSIKINTDDLLLGGDAVYFCDEILVGNNLRGPNYGSGNLIFKIRESKD